MGLPKPSRMDPSFETEAEADAEFIAKVIVTQNSHGFSVGNVLKRSGSVYALAKADTSANAEAVGIVSEVTSVNIFVLTTGGRVTGLTGITDGAVYFLSTVTAGLLTTDDASIPGHVSKPQGIGDSTTSIIYHNFRGTVVSSGTPYVSGGTDVAVADGGTGRSSHTEYAVICGGTTTTAAQQSVASAGTAGQFLGSNGAGALPTMQAIPLIVVSDQKTSGTNGGTFTSGGWRTRDINTEDYDGSSLCSIAANQITLAAGDYIAIIRAPATQIGYHQSRLQNVTDAVTLLVGSDAYTYNSAVYAQTDSFIIGKFSIAASKAIEIQHICYVTCNTFGFGITYNLFSKEVYTQALFWKIG